MGNLLQKIHFTKSEFRVIVFLLLVLLSGLLIKLSKNYLAPGKDSFDYRKTDRIFGSRINGTSPAFLDSTDNNDTSYFSAKEKEMIDRTNRRTDSLGKTNGKSTKKGSKEENLKGKTININTASKEELTLLPGVGESTAEKIIAYRSEHKGFKKIEDIQKIKGIGKKKFEKLKPFITVN